MTIRADDLTPTIAPPDPNPKKPGIALPPLACDSHFHVFGPHSKFPYAADRSFTPPDAPKEDLFRLHEFLGFQRGVFVQSTCHGTDNSVLVDLLAAGKGRYRGVALLDPRVPDAEVERLDDAGVRGVRLHFLTGHLGPAKPREDMLRIIDKVAPYGWHIEMHVGGNNVVDLYEFITSIEAPVVIDHIGRIDIAEGLHGKAFSVLRRLLDRGNVWVKLSGTDRISKQKYPYADAIAFPRDLAAHAPERVVWGTDWPHPNHNAMPNDGELTDLIAEIAPDARTRQLMLVDNPAKLFGFNFGSYRNMTKKTLGKLPPDAIGMLELPALPAGILDGYRALRDLTGSASDAMDELGIVGAVPAAVLRPTDPKAQIVGRALTVRNIAASAPVSEKVKAGVSGLGEIEAHNLAEPGDVLVVQGVDGVSNLGGMSATIGHRQGEIGAIVDGGARDVDHSRTIGLPVWSKSVSPITGKWRVETVAVNKPVSVCGITVNPGDLVLADETGVCFIPRERAGDVLQRAQRNAAAEKLRDEKIASGVPLAELMGKAR